MVEYDMDILALTETWLTSNPADEIYVYALSLPGYKLYHVPPSKTADDHDGVAVLYKTGLKVMHRGSVLSLRGLYHNIDVRQKAKVLWYFSLPFCQYKQCLRWY